MKKKFLSVLLAGAMVLSLAACGNSVMGQRRLNDRHQGPGRKQERPLFYSISDQVEILSQTIQST